ncbi:MAG: ATP-binding cassette domain-containing protein [Ectothiorhodospiraceae bacterium]|nr:ATP-binding cassette domain-containing protein [Ectothiorhodospiraceae bacterium]MCH8505317.1 ATP-binding cassette domain-containing protein [Ectothiorhodospiraceae bacterium]
MLRFTQVQYRYPSTEALSLPDWEAAQGEHWLLLGASGSGKTTMLQLAAGLLTPTAGTVEVAEQRLASLSGRTLDRFRGQRIGIVFQTLHLVSALTVEQNLRLAQYLAGLPQDSERITEVLEPLGIAHKRKRRPHQLSQGEAQRVALARAVLNRPSVLLADEPTSALDDRSCEQVAKLLLSQARACGATLVIATHDARLGRYIPQQLQLEAAA